MIMLATKEMIRFSLFMFVYNSIMSEFIDMISFLPYKWFMRNVKRE